MKNLFGIFCLLGSISAVGNSNSGKSVLALGEIYGDTETFNGTSLNDLLKLAEQRGWTSKVDSSGRRVRLKKGRMGTKISLSRDQTQFE